MTRNRSSIRTLTGTRIYLKHGKFYYVAPEPMLNRKTGKVSKWHILCTEKEGEDKAREVRNNLIGTVESPIGSGDFPAYFSKWQKKILKDRSDATPKDPAHAVVWATGTRNLKSSLLIIEKAFRDCDVANIEPVEVAEFLDQWEGRRSAQTYKATLSKFFSWCCRKGTVKSNPAKEVEVTAPPKRDVYITDEQFNAVRAHLLIGEDKKPTRTGEMVKCYVELLYMLFQRGTEIRLLRWDQITPEGIVFKPTKTEKKAGTKVLWPITEDVRAIFNTAKKVAKMGSMYIISNEQGQPYTTHGIATMFIRACKRAKIEGITLKDIRSKASTDAINQGYTMEQLQVSLAHTDSATTRGYVKNKVIPVNEIILSLPDIENQNHIRQLSNKLSNKN